MGDPEEHDYDAAADYLSLIAEAPVVDRTVAALRTADPTFRKAKDILRAAGLPLLLPETSKHVRTDLGKIHDGAELSPILLVRGDFYSSALQVADGYHRVCASYLTDENTSIPCRLVSWQT